MDYCGSLPVASLPAVHWTASFSWLFGHWENCKTQYSIGKTTSKRSFTFGAEASRSQIGYERSIRTRCMLARRPAGTTNRRNLLTQFGRREMRHFAPELALQANGLTWNSFSAHLPSLKRNH